MKSSNRLWGVIFAVAAAAGYCEAGENLSAGRNLSWEEAAKKEVKKEKAEPERSLQPVANPVPVKTKSEDRARQEYEQHIKETRSKRRMWDTMMCPSRIYDRS